MFNEKMKALGEKRSAIRELAEFAKQLAARVGEENVFDFSIGNPSVPTPDAVNNALKQQIDNNKNVHGYTTAAGLLSVREKIAQTNNQRYGTKLKAEHIYLTCGASAALAISLRAAICPEQDEVVLITPYFPEYCVFAENAGGKTVVVPMDETDFQIDFQKLQASLSPRTSAVIVNSPNNPSGIVYSKETLQKLANVLEDAQQRFNSVILLISDEPYREIVFDCPFESPLNYYKNSVLCYSFSKSFSLAGERIGYVALSEELTGADEYYNAILGAGRSLGYVCAPGLFQHAVADCVTEQTNVSPYRQNRDMLVKNLLQLGFSVVNPQGAFYVLLKTPTECATEFSNVAKHLGLLVVPTDTFGLAGYVRIATCVSQQMIERSLPAWKKLAQIYYGN